VSDSSDVRSALHKAHEEGYLRLLVGAGASTGSGFPGWDQLNLSLLERAMHARAGESVLRPTSRAIREAAERIYEAIGRDGAADYCEHLFRENERDPQRAWQSAFAKALYGDRASVEAVPVRSLHKQLAALGRSGKREVYTTNFDPLLERAWATIAGNPSDWKRFRHTKGAAEGVHHLHGWLDPDGDAGGKLVLTETSYLEILRDPTSDINANWKQLFDNDHTVLIVGMSLADPNLRRVLHLRRSMKLRDAKNKVYALLRERDDVVDRSLVDYWRTWDLQVVLIDDYAYIPEFLRDIAWGVGGAPSAEPAWASASRAWLAGTGAKARFSDDWQSRTHAALVTLRDRLRNTFGVRAEEQLVVTLFLPDMGTEGVLQKIATSREARTGLAAEAHAKARALSISRDRPQGVAGSAFVTGVSAEELDNGPAINQSFTPAMVEAWDHDVRYRDWRSVVAVPVLDTEHWLPVAVITVTSNLSEPFWSRFGARAQRELPEMKAMMRRTAKWVVSPSP